MASLFNLFRRTRPEGTQTYNKVYDALLKWGFKFTQYDNNAKTYIESGYNINSDVFAVISQKSNEVTRIPYFIKKVKNEQAKERWNQLRQKYSPEIYLKKVILESKAFDVDDEIKLPLDKPNVLQSWREMFALYETFMDLTGNAYFYLLAPEEGMNAGTPIQIYLLPSHLIQIVLKKDVEMMGMESPIDYYILTEGDQYIEFEAKNVIKVSLSNPNFDMSGSHLYGQSRLRAALKDIQASNEGRTLNARILANGGSFGFLSSKQPLTAEQAQGLKDRLIEMDNSPERLSNIAGASAEVTFTKISLSTEELKPFDYLEYSQKAICNVLQWDDKLLNSDDGAKYDNMKYAIRRSITSGISPNLRLLEEAFTNDLLPRFKGYEGTVWVFDESELPEMQEDMAQLTVWLNSALDRGVINRNEYRQAIKYQESDRPEMEIHTVSMTTMNLEDAVTPAEPFEPFVDESTDV